MAAVAQSANVHARAQPYVLHVGEVFDIVLVVFGNGLLYDIFSH
jgi:hypothetical protein